MVTLDDKPTSDDAAVDAAGRAADVAVEKSPASKKKDEWRRGAGRERPSGEFDATRMYPSGVGFSVLFAATA